MKMDGGYWSSMDRDLACNDSGDIEVDDTIQQGCMRGWCRGEPITEGGKRRQMARMLTLILTPIVVLMAVSFYFVSENLSAKMESDKVKGAVLFSVEVGKVIHAMQSERDMSVLYLSSIGPETKSFLTTRYLETNEQLANLPDWPTGLITYELPQFYSKREFQHFLTRHRNELDIFNHTLYDEIIFYTDHIRIFVRWLYDAIKESQYGTIWKTLVAYQKVVEAKEHVGIERAIGSAYFSRGGFVTQQIYEWYNQELHAFRANIKSAGRYSSSVNIIANARINSGGANLTIFVELFRRVIQRREISAPSLRTATHYFDNMTLYIDLVFLAVKDLAEEIIIALDNRAESVSLGVLRSSIIICVVLLMCPILVKTMQTLTNDIQRYALTLVEKTNELNREKRRTDSILYQMLPKPVAERIKYNRHVTAEYFKEVTISFSDIVGFSQLMNECPPTQVMSVLDNTMSLLDECMEEYDVFKVDTVGDAYVIASGLPERNGDNHAAEIAHLSLDVLNACPEISTNTLTMKSVALRIGIHTGPCGAGLVGGALPKYCMFGDTVSIASALESHGEESRVHISKTTYRLLQKLGEFKMAERGQTSLKARCTVMTTYWLTGRNVQRKPKIRDCSNSEFDKSLIGSQMSLGDATNDVKDNVQGMKAENLAETHAEPEAVINTGEPNDTVVTITDENDVTDPSTL